VFVGVVLSPTMYHQTYDLMHAAPPEGQAKYLQALSVSENIKLIQLYIGLLFSVFLVIGLRARKRDAGLHKRMMILATAIPLPAGIDRIEWIPSSLPGSPLTPILFTIVAVSPMFVWDVVRNRSIHRAYWIWLGLFLPVGVVVFALWDKPWWHSVAKWLMGV